MPGPPLPGGPVLAGNGKKPLRPSLRSATSPVRGGCKRLPFQGSWPSLRGLRGFGSFPQAPFSLTFFEKKVSKEALNILLKKHLLTGHTHTGQQVLLFTV